MKTAEELEILILDQLEEVTDPGTSPRFTYNGDVVYVDFRVNMRGYRIGNRGYERVESLQDILERAQTFVAAYGTVQFYSR